jgi:hypothetical protein
VQEGIVTLLASVGEIVMLLASAEGNCNAFGNAFGKIWANFKNPGFSTSI